MQGRAERQRPRTEKSNQQRMLNPPSLSFFFLSHWFATRRENMMLITAWMHAARMDRIFFFPFPKFLAPGPVREGILISHSVPNPLPPRPQIATVSRESPPPQAFSLMFRANWLRGSAGCVAGILSPCHKQRQNINSKADLAR